MNGRGWGLGTRDQGLGNQESGLGTPDLGLGTRDSGLLELAVGARPQTGAHNSQ
jgi:hypothetical protein